MNASSPPYQLFADLVVLVHVVFVIFAVLGGLLAARWQGASMDSSAGCYLGGDRRTFRLGVPFDTARELAPTASRRKGLWRRFYRTLHSPGSLPGRTNS